MPKKLLAYLPALAWACLICYLSVGNIPNVFEELQWLSPDKIGHLAFYGMQAILLFRSQYWQGKKTSRGFFALACFLAFGLGLSMELVQANLPHRQFDYADLAANTLGIALAYLLYRQLNLQE